MKKIKVQNLELSLDGISQYRIGIGLFFASSQTVKVEVYRGWRRRCLLVLAGWVLHGRSNATNRTQSCCISSITTYYSTASGISDIFQAHYRIQHYPQFVSLAPSLPVRRREVPPLVCTAPLAPRSAVSQFIPDRYDIYHCPIVDAEWVPSFRISKVETE